MALRKTLTRVSGFSVVETLVVLGLLGMLGGLGLTVGMDTFRRYNFRNEQLVLWGALQKARVQALSNINQKPHGVYIQASPRSYVLYQGASYAARDASLDVVFAGREDYIVTGLSEVTFAQLTGQPTTVGSIKLDDQIDPPVSFCLNSEGQINPKSSCP